MYTPGMEELNSLCTGCNANDLVRTQLPWAKNTCASAGSRTRVDCLEGNHANRYTTDANTVLSPLKAVEFHGMGVGIAQRSIHSSEGVTSFLDALLDAKPRETTHDVTGP